MKHRGFTLIEIIVALAVFSIVAVVALGALVKIISANSKAQTVQSAITNLNFALDAISREMRVGSAYYCSPSGTLPSGTTLSGAQACAVGKNQLIAFKSSKTALVSGGTTRCRLVYAYKFVPADVSQGTDGPWILNKATQNTCEDSLASLQFAPIISEEVTIQDFRVGVTYGQTTAPYPLVFLRLTGYAGVRESDKTYFDLQTSIAERVP